jgi:hypothetical protein
MARSTVRRYRISSEFEEGLIRQQQERAWIVQAEISSPIVAALFEIGSAKLQLETQGLPEGKQITQASERLSEAVKISNVLEGTRDENGRSGK